MMTNVEGDRDDPSQLPTLLVELPSVAYVGLPIPCAATLSNPSQTISYPDAPVSDYLADRGPVGIRLADGGVISVASASHVPKFDLFGGDSFRMLMDVGEAFTTVAPGALALAVRYEGLRIVSNEVAASLTLERLEGDHVEIVELIRCAPTWDQFLGFNWTTPDVSRLPKLPQPVREALVFHLFLHETTYGPHALSSIHPDRVPAGVQKPLDVEVLLLRHELLVLQASREADGLRAEVERRASGCTWRLNDNEGRQGMLSRLRHSVGRERQLGLPPSPLPYDLPEDRAL